MTRLWDQGDDTFETSLEVVNREHPQQDHDQQDGSAERFLLRPIAATARIRRDRGKKRFVLGKRKW